MKKLRKEKTFIGLKSQVQRSGLKLTKQREAILRAFFFQNGHRSAEEILTDVRKRDSRVSLATIYRTLKLLIEHGFAESHNFQDGQAVFEPCYDKEDHHDHLICTKCQRIVEFVEKDIEELQVKVAKEHGFLIGDHKMEIYGLCQSCQQKTKSFSKGVWPP